MVAKIARIYIWVPGRTQPNELACWNNGHKTRGGQDFEFDTYQEAFDAADILRKAGMAYELQATPINRKPWLTVMPCCGSQQSGG